MFIQRNAARCQQKTKQTKSKNNTQLAMQQGGGDALVNLSNKKEKGKKDAVRAKECHKSVCRGALSTGALTAMMLIGDKTQRLHAANRHQCCPTTSLQCILAHFKGGDKPIG
jgi:hypothetical protein